MNQQINEKSLEDCKEELRLLNNTIIKINHIKGNTDDSTDEIIIDDIRLFKFKNNEIDNKKSISIKSFDKAYKKLNKYKDQALERYNLLIPILHNKIDDFNKAVKNYNQSVDIYNEWLITKGGGYYSNKIGKARTKNKRGKNGNRIMRLNELQYWIKELNEKSIDLIID